VAMLREFVITAGHEVLAHAGAEITLSFLRRYFWWDKMAKDVTDFCRSCEPCARGKTTTRKPFGKIHPMPIPSRPWEETALDFITGLPAVIHKREMVDSILVVTCVFSKYVHLFPVSTSYSGRDIAQVYFDGVYKHHGAQRAITSDRDPKFNAGFWRALHELIGTSLRMSGSNHPETDGVSEQKVKVTSQALRILASDNPDLWPTLLSAVEFALNLGIAGATGLSAFEASTGWQPRPWPMDMGASSGVPAADGIAGTTTPGDHRGRILAR
jgi:RNase P/RNase MRP subunit p29